MYTYYNQAYLQRHASNSRFCRKYQLSALPWIAPHASAVAEYVLAAHLCGHTVPLALGVEADTDAAECETADLKLSA